MSKKQTKNKEDKLFVTLSKAKIKEYEETTRRIQQKIEETELTSDKRELEKIYHAYVVATSDAALYLATNIYEIVDDDKFGAVNFYGKSPIKKNKIRKGFEQRTKVIDSKYQFLDNILK